MQTANKIIVNNVQMNSNINSEAIPLPNIYGFAVQAVYTGTPTGTIKLQASVDAFKYASDINPQVPTNWNDIDNSSLIVSSAGIYTINFIGSFYTFFRFVYTDASGGTSTARVTVTVNMKG